MGENLVRFGVSIPAKLLARFDEQIAAKGYGNRSEALRDLIRDHLVGREWESDAVTVGTITIVYDHHQRELTEALTAMQHDHGEKIISTLHIHLDHDHCLEVIVIRGRASELSRFADRLIGTKGVVHGRLTAATTGSSF